MVAISRPLSGITAFLSGVLLAQGCATSEPAILATAAPAQLEELVPDSATISQPEQTELQAPIYVVRTRTDNYRVADAWASDSKQNYQAKYGGLYRQLRLRTTGEFDVGAGARSFRCSDKRAKNNPVVKALNALLGREKNRALIITATLTGKTTGADRLIAADVPFMSYVRNKGECSIYKPGDVTLTQLVSPAAADRIQVEFKIRYSKKDRINLANTLGLIGTVFGFVTQTPTDGVVSGVTEIATSGINDQINNLLAQFDRAETLGSPFLLPMEIENALQYDALVMTFARPAPFTDGDWAVKTPGAAQLVLAVDYRPSLFVACADLDIQKCSAFDSPGAILDKGLDGKPLRTISEETPTSIDSYARQLIDADKKPQNERKTAIGNVCDTMRRDPKFTPMRYLNALDSTIFLYTLLERYSSYKTDPTVRSPKCLGNDDIAVRLGLNSQRFALEAGSRSAAQAVAAYAGDIVGALSRGQLQDLLAPGAVVNFDLDIMRNGAAGEELRRLSYSGAEGSEIVASLSPEGAQFCSQHTLDPITQADSDRKFGFWVAVWDKKKFPDRNQRTVFAAPVVAERDPSSADLRLKSLNFASPGTYFNEVYAGARPDRPALSEVVEHLSRTNQGGPRCLTDGRDTDAVRALVQLLSAGSGAPN